MILPEVASLLVNLKERDKERKKRAIQRRRVTYNLRVKGVTDLKKIEHELAIIEYEQTVAEERQKRARYQLQDPTKISVNISQLLADESNDEEYGSARKMKQDLLGIETDFKFENKVESLKFEERNIRVAKARQRLRNRKVYIED